MGTINFALVGCDRQAVAYAQNRRRRLGLGRRPCLRHRRLQAPSHPSVPGSMGSLPFERGPGLQGVCAAWEGHFNAG